jgi:hypothetical protein
MKILDVKKVEKATKAAMLAYTKAFISQAKLRIMMITACLVLALAVQAQNFSKIDYRGKTKYEIAKVFEAKCMCSELDRETYYSNSYGAVMFYYNKFGICYKISVRRPLTFDQSISVVITKDETSKIYTVQ